ncbi:MAG TPA: S53 family peptidase [Steroidobacteraceae bacterium]|nr:S53 family peptidase [Steroidobacteraceae bacterium]
MRMRNRTQKVLCAAVALVSTLALGTVGGSSTHAGNSMHAGTIQAGLRAHHGAIASPAFVMGPRAVPAAVGAQVTYGLFTCQVNQVPGVNCLDPYEVRHAYGTDTLINKGLDGTGKTIVIIDAFQNPNIMEELIDFDAFYGLPVANFTQIEPQGPPPAFDENNGDMVSWAVEISLDVQWAHAIAPGARIVLVLAVSDADQDIYNATKYAVDNRLGDIISQSFGENEACMDPNLVIQQHAMFAEATLKNMTIFASSGDFGAGQPTCDGSALVQAAGTPASDPLVTAVGGTTLDAAYYCIADLGCNPKKHPAPGTYLGEVVWNEPAYGASGGGFSVLYDKPAYQQGFVDGSALGVPDIAYNASVNNGVLTVLDIGDVAPLGFYLIGGTSAGSPQWSAITAIADQKAGHDLGFINAALYRIGDKQPIYNSALNDIKKGNNSFDGVTGFSARPHWDATTGLGSPQAVDLVNDIILLHSPLDGLAEIVLSSHGKGGKGHGHKKPH